MAELPVLTQQLSKINELSAQVASASTVLSTRLAETEEMLNRLPGKLTVEIAIGGGVNLKFDREGTGWRLFAVDANSRTKKRLSDAMVDTKIRSAQHLPYLLANMAQANEARLEEINLAIRALDAVDPALAPLIGKEGA